MGALACRICQQGCYNLHITTIILDHSSRVSLPFHPCKYTHAHYAVLQPIYRSKGWSILNTLYIIVIILAGSYFLASAIQGVQANVITVVSPFHANGLSSSIRAF
jgi:hypothetical protein